MRIVAPIGRTARGVQDALAVPPLQGFDRAPDESRKRMWRVEPFCFHTHILSHMSIKTQAISRSISPLLLEEQQGKMSHQHYSASPSEQDRQFAKKL